MNFLWISGISIFLVLFLTCLYFFGNFEEDIEIEEVEENPKITINIYLSEKTKESI